MNRIGPITHALLRIFTGLLYICPGTMKLFGWFGGMPGGMKLTPLLWVAGIIEVVGGTMIVLGLFTRAVAFIASGEMAAAFFIGHFPKGVFPIQNHGEAAYLLCFIFLFLWGNGPGAWSLDGLRGERKRM